MVKEEFFRIVFSTYTQSGGSNDFVFRVPDDGRIRCPSAWRETTIATKRDRIEAVRDALNLDAVVVGAVSFPDARKIVGLCQWSQH